MEIYINALVSNRALAESVKEYDGFSDIEFNPKKNHLTVKQGRLLYF